MLSCVGRPLMDRYYGFCQLKTQMITPHYISNVLHDQIEQNTPRDFNDDLTSNEPQTCSKTCYQLVVLINFFPAKFSCCCCAGITSFLRFDFGMHAITLCFYDQHCAGESPAPLPFVCYRFSLVSFRSFHLLSIHRPSKVVPLGLFRKEAQQQNRVRIRESRDEPCFGGAQQRAHTQPRKCSIHQYRQVKKARKKHTLLFASSLWHKIFLVSRVPTHRSKGRKNCSKFYRTFHRQFPPQNGQIYRKRVHTALWHTLRALSSRISFRKPPKLDHFDGARCRHSTVPSGELLLTLEKKPKQALQTVALRCVVFAVTLRNCAACCVA